MFRAFVKHPSRGACQCIGCRTKEAEQSGTYARWDTQCQVWVKVACEGPADLLGSVTCCGSR